MLFEEETGYTEVKAHHNPQMAVQSDSPHKEPTHFKGEEPPLCPGEGNASILLPMDGNSPRTPRDGKSEVQFGAACMETPGALSGDGAASELATSALRNTVVHQVDPVLNVERGSPLPRVRRRVAGTGMTSRWTKNGPLTPIRWTRSGLQNTSLRGNRVQLLTR